MTFPKRIYITKNICVQLIRKVRERLDGWRAWWSEESLPTAPDTRISVKDIGREPGLWHRNDNHPLKMRWCKCWGLRENGWNGESSWVQVGNWE